MGTVRAGAIGQSATRGAAAARPIRSVNPSAAFVAVAPKPRVDERDLLPRTLKDPDRTISLVESDGIRVVDLSRRRLSPVHVERLASALETNVSATSLLLARCGIYDDAAKCLAAAISRNSTVVILDLSRNDIEVDGVRSIADMLKRRPTLESLVLSRVDLRPASAEALAEALLALGAVEGSSSPSRLSNLDLCGTGLGIDGAQGMEHVARALGVLNAASLQTLDLSCNDLEPAGAAHVASMLGAESSRLSHLDLAGNDIACLGAQRIAEALESNVGLKTLILSTNSIGPLGAERLAAALEGNGSLTDLGLASNNVGCHGAERLAAAVAVNGALQRLDVSRNFVGPFGADRLAAAMATGSLMFLDLSWNGVSAANAAQYVIEEERGCSKLEALSSAAQHGVGAFMIRRSTV